MPIYEYVCSACAHRTDILHGLNDTGPHFCPECGAEGTMRKAFAPPAIVFKGSGWAKKDRAASSAPAKKNESTSSSSAGGSSAKEAESTSAPSSTSTDAS